MGCSQSPLLTTVPQQRHLLSLAAHAGRSPGSEAQEAYFQPLAGGEDDFSSPEEYGQNGYGMRR